MILFLPSRFVNHQRKGVSVLLHNWIPLAIAIENAIANASNRTLNATLKGILKKIRSAAFLATACIFKSILSVVAALSLKLEKDSIMPFEVAPAVALAQAELEELLQDNECHLTKQGLTLTESTVSASLPKPGHMKRNPENRQYTDVEYTKMTHAGLVEGTVKAVKDSTLPLSSECLRLRFQSFDSAPFPAMLWVDPANWQDMDKELDMMMSLAERFAVPLRESGFDATNLKAEWKVTKHTVKYFYPSVTSPASLWQRLLSYRRKQFPNVCLLVEVVLAIGVSNGTVESCFSYLTAMLTDRRLSLLHTTMSDLLIIRANHATWSDHERKEIISAALGEYMSGRRKMQLEPQAPDDSGEPAPKRALVASSSSGDSSTSSSENGDVGESDSEAARHCLEVSSAASSDSRSDLPQVLGSGSGSDNDLP
eukprot:scpid74025/ scgid1779/ 